MKITATMLLLTKLSEIQMRLIGYCIFTTIVLSSCASLHEIDPDSSRSIRTLEEFQTINGDYEILDHLDSKLQLQNRTEKNYIAGKSCFIRLTVLSTTQLKVQRIDAEKVLEEKILKGKLKDDYFIVNTSFSVPDFYFLYNLYTTNKTRIGKKLNGNITIDNESGGCAMLVIFPILCNGTESYDIEYSKM
jgi:hypothetical protein